MGPGVLAFAVGTAIAYWMYVSAAGKPGRDLGRMAHLACTGSCSTSGVSTRLYDATVVAAADALAETALAIDVTIVDGIIAKLPALLASLFGSIFRAFQTGVVHVYGVFMVIGLASFGWFFVVPHPAGTVATVGTDTGDYVVTAGPGMGYQYRWDTDGKGLREQKADETSVKLHLDEGKTQNVLHRGDERVRVPPADGDPDHARDRRETAATGAELMSATAHNDALPAAPLRFGARELVLLGLLGAATIAIAWLVPGLVPLAIAGGVAATVPRKHDWTTRAVLAAMAALFALFVTRMWPDVSAIPDATRPPYEPATLLSWLIGLPIAGAVAVLFLPRQTPALLRVFTMLVMLATLGASALLLGVPMDRGFHFSHDIAWLPRLGIRYHVAATGSRSGSSCSRPSSPRSRPTRPSGRSGAAEGLVLRAPLARGGDGRLAGLDGPVPLLRLLGADAHPDGRDDRRVGRARPDQGGAEVLPLHVHGLGPRCSAPSCTRRTRTGRSTGGPMSFDYFELQRVLYPQHIQIWLFGAFALAFLIKVPMFPFHTWLPDAHTEAPTAGSIILAAVLLKMGTYGYLRFCMGLFPEAAIECGAILAGVAVLGGTIYGALCAWQQDDVKRLVAYSSVAHLGYVMLGIFAATTASLEGSVLQMVNHGISTGALFLLVGVLYDRRHTREIDEFGGLAKVMPVYATIFVIVTLSSIGLPGTNGFIGEFMVITGTFVSTKLGHFNGIQVGRRGARRRPRRALHARRGAEGVLRPGDAQGERADPRHQPPRAPGGRAASSSSSSSSVCSPTSSSRRCTAPASACRTTSKRARRTTPPRSSTRARSASCRARARRRGSPPRRSRPRTRDCPHARRLRPLSAARRRGRRADAHAGRRAVDQAHPHGARLGPDRVAGKGARARHDDRPAHGARVLGGRVAPRHRRPRGRQRASPVADRRPLQPLLRRGALPRRSADRAHRRRLPAGAQAGTRRVLPASSSSRRSAPWCSRPRAIS